MSGINSSRDITIVYDRERLKPKETEYSNKSRLNIDLHISDRDRKSYSRDISKLDNIDSVKKPVIWASVFVASAFHMSLKHNEPIYHNLLEW